MTQVTEYACTAAQAVARGQSVVGWGGSYVLGTGDFNPASKDDKPWTNNALGTGSDCAGFAVCWAWRLVRHRPGFNLGPWATVSDDLNCDSVVEDSEHKQELFLPVDLAHDDPRPGDLVVWPTVRVQASAPPHDMLSFMGHVGLVERVLPGSVTLDRGAPLEARLRPLIILQCHGPTGRTPGVVRTDGTLWANHAVAWPRPEHTSRVIRPRERTERT